MEKVKLHDPQSGERLKKAQFFRIMEAYWGRVLRKRAVKINEMCQAIQEIRTEERLLGEQEGKQEGRLLQAQESARKFYNLWD